MWFVIFFFFILRFRKPKREDLLTAEYYKTFTDHEEIDNISLHKGDDWDHSRREPRQGSNRSNNSWWNMRKSPTEREHQDEKSLLDADENEADV